MFENDDELPDEAYQEIKSLCAEGDALAGRHEFREAVEVYQHALQLVPDPKEEWQASTWILAAIGDALFLGGHPDYAVRALQDAMICPGGLGNPFLHLRLGQVQFELGELDRAADELMRAYMGAGEEIFSTENPKYRTFLATRALID